MHLSITVVPIINILIFIRGYDVGGDWERTALLVVVIGFIFIPLPLVHLRLNFILNLVEAFWGCLPALSFVGILQLRSFPLSTCH